MPPALGYRVEDRGGDIEFAQHIGARGILVLTGYGKGEWELFGDQWKVKLGYIARDLYDAVLWIIQQESVQ